MSKYYAMEISLPEKTSHHTFHRVIYFSSNCYYYIFLHRYDKSADIFTRGEDAVLMGGNRGFQRGIDARQAVDMKTV